MSPALHGVLIFSLLVAIGLRVPVLCERPKRKRVLRCESLETNDSAAVAGGGGQAFATEDWTLAVEACEKIVDAEPDNVQAWARLAYALHMLGPLRSGDRGLLARASFRGPASPVGVVQHCCDPSLKNEKQPGPRLPPGGGGSRLSATCR